MADTVSASELKQTLDQFVVIDVRELNLPIARLMAQLTCPWVLLMGKIDDLKEKKICTFCGSGEILH